MHDTGCQSTHAYSTSEMKEKEKGLMERDDMIEKEKRVTNDEIGIGVKEGEEVEESKEKEVANLTK